ncbi:hypothetical protein [Gordonia paraffinivorans]|uniref:hypothetical protein n=1 Tax=Gordonia paraffinivorans TaxID=175628 RepID=UPI003FCD289D
MVVEHHVDVDDPRLRGIDRGHLADLCAAQQNATAVLDTGTERGQDEMQVCSFRRGGSRIDEREHRDPDDQHHQRRQTGGYEHPGLAPGISPDEVLTAVHRHVNP